MTYLGGGGGGAFGGGGPVYPRRGAEGGWEVCEECGSQYWSTGDYLCARCRSNLESELEARRRHRLAGDLEESGV
jgi:hypothetical protein